ncbi:MAG TPA: dihydrolipoamide acetyltransferase family protein, partial [Spirochaetia bacterium]|nr:dihydrolipoamide acetyltransferase family protein [Spirochaetia bacterium]
EGTLLKILLPEGGQAKVGDVIAIVGKPGEDISGIVAGLGPGSSADHASARTPAQAAHAQAPAAAPAAVSAQPQASRAAPASGRIKSSPLARKVAAQKGVDLRSLVGSGPDGRIVLRDLEKLPGSAAPGQQAPQPALLQPGAGDVVVPISRMRKIIARRLSESMYSAPHYYLTVAVGMDGLLAARTKMNAGREKKLSVNAFLMSIAGRTLARHPQVNTTWNGDTFLRHPTADIGLAVALPEGLITPVVRDCGRKGIIAIDTELADLVERARAGKLAPEEYAGAGFTISNLGMSGIDEFTAIINPPGSAILAVGAVRKEVVVTENDALVVRQRMRMTLSCDHRVIDGAVGAAFLRELADMIENPLLALA